MVKRFVLIAALAAAGCGERRPALYPVTGELFVNGKPAPGAIVSLHPVDGKDFDERGARPMGRVRDDGGFSLSTYTTGDGAPTGEYRVCVTWFEQTEDPAKAKDRLDLKYARAEDSTIVVRVGAGPTTLDALRIDGPPVKK